MEYYDDISLEREIRSEFYRDYYSRLRKAQKKNNEVNTSKDDEDNPF
jgi:hypothetical protein